MMNIVQILMINACLALHHIQKNCIIYNISRYASVKEKQFARQFKLSEFISISIYTYSVLILYKPL